MKNKTVLLFLFLFVVWEARASSCACCEGIRSVLGAQQNAWNTGNLEAFMDGYYQGPELRFVSGSKVTTGWQQTLDNYKKTYTSKEAMGTLVFSELEITCTGRSHAYVSGAWQLNFPENQPVGGRFTLIFKKIKSNWKIVYDHTS